MKLLQLLADASTALNQVGLLLAAAFFVGMATLLLGNRLYWRVRARRMKGTVVGVRSVQKNRYHAVYRFKLPTGKWAQATSDTGVGVNSDLETGRKVQLLVFKKFPDRATDASHYILESVGGVFFLLAVVTGGAAMALWPVTTLTWVLISAIGAFVVYLLTKTVPGRGEPPFASLSRGARPHNLEESPLQKIEEILSGPIQAERRRRQIAAGRMVTPILVVAGIGVVALGGYLGRKTYLLQSKGEHAQGTVLFFELKTTLHGSKYYPVVQFATRDGASIQFRDPMGSSPPAYGEGDPVNVLYFRNLPEETATIDHGMLDWLAPGALCVVGTFLAAIALWVRLGALG